MCNTAVMQLISNLSQGKFIVNEQFFHVFDLVGNNVLFNCSSLNF
ncbi:MAG: hypothetical protein K0Q79_3632, partial [Flavipsychrobacter sp.]|nr:hypothetical protein [Flavipsychrobacter sp.]